MAVLDCGDDEAQASEHDHQVDDPRADGDQYRLVRYPSGLGCAMKPGMPLRPRRMSPRT